MRSRSLDDAGEFSGREGGESSMRSRWQKKKTRWPWTAAFTANWNKSAVFPLQIEVKRLVQRIWLVVGATSFARFRSTHLLGCPDKQMRSS